jgi:hypothetical protein
MTMQTWVPRMLVALIVLAGAAADAHHSFTAEFDENKPVTLAGAVTEMRWSNPHGWIYIDVKGPDGKVVNWGCETGGVNALYRRGWRKEDLAVGTMVTIDGWQARNGTPTMNARSILLPDGRRLFAGSSNSSASQGESK